MDERIVDALEAAAQATGEPYMRMHSGAAHDTMCVADRVPTAMVFVPCKDGISHHPAEDASPADAALAAEIILNAVQALALRVGEQAAGEQDLALARGQGQLERNGAAVELGGAGLDRRTDARDRPLVALLDALVVRLVGERQRHDPLRDQVRAVDAGEALRDDRADAEVERRERRLLAARALAVVVARRRRSRRPTPPREPGTPGRSGGT